jgi:hypothetical protein
LGKDGLTTCGHSIRRRTPPPISRWTPAAAFKPSTRRTGPNGQASTTSRQGISFTGRPPLSAAGSLLAYRYRSSLDVTQYTPFQSKVKKGRPQPLITAAGKTVGHENGGQRAALMHRRSTFSVREEVGDARGHSGVAVQSLRSDEGMVGYHRRGYDASCQRVLALLAHRCTLDAQAPPLHARLITDLRERIRDTPREAVVPPPPA